MSLVHSTADQIFRKLNSNNYSRGRYRRNNKNGGGSNYRNVNINDKNNIYLEERIPQPPMAR